MFSLCPPLRGEGGEVHPSGCLGGGDTLILPDCGYPHPRSEQGREGVPHLADRGYPHLSNGGYPPHQDWITPPPPIQHWKGITTPPPPPRSGDRAAWRALATRQPVCLLRSRRRTFMLRYIFMSMLCALKLNSS